MKLTSAELRRLATAKRDVPVMTEAQLQSAIIENAGYLGWRHFHVHDSRHSVSGFPDLILVRGDRIIAAELKNATRKATVEQLEWLSALEAAGVESHLWRPDAWRSGEVERCLR